MSIAKNKRAKNTSINLAPSWENPEVSTLPIEGFRYTSSEFYEKEWNQMWTKVWLLLGRKLSHIHISEHTRRTPLSKDDDS